MFKSFITPVCKITKKIDNLGSIIQALETLKKDDILIGIPQEKSSRPGEVNNAELAYVHEQGVKPDIEAQSDKSSGSGWTSHGQALDAYLFERGDPMWHIPPRPLLEPAIKANADKITAQQSKIIKAALAGETEKVKIEIMKLGMLGQNILKAWFVDPRNNWAPNAPSTIARKKSDQPMIDTGALRNSISYVVRPAK